MAKWNRVSLDLADNGRLVGLSQDRLLNPRLHIGQ